jgi:hypothetical protein
VSPASSLVLRPHAGLDSGRPTLYVLYLDYTRMTCNNTSGERGVRPASLGGQTSVTSSINALWAVSRLPDQVDEASVQASAASTGRCMGTGNGR